MQNIQKKYKAIAQWFTISSSVEGKQGYISDTASAMRLYKKEEMESTALLLDRKGLTGKQFGAKTTPHLYIINPKGKIVYEGGIDDTPGTSTKEIKTIFPSSY